MFGFAMRAKFILYSLLGIAIISEMIILNQNFILKRRLNEYTNSDNNQLSIIQEELVALKLMRSIEGRVLPLSRLQKYMDQSMVAATSSRLRYILAFCFTGYDCESCLQNEITTWNQFHNSFKSETLQVIGITDSLSLRGSMEQSRWIRRTRFPVYAVDNIDEFLAGLGVSATPAVFLLDGCSNVIPRCFFPSPAWLSKDSFAGKVQNLIEGCN